MTRKTTDGKLGELKDVAVNIRKARERSTPKEKGRSSLKSNGRRKAVLPPVIAIFGPGEEAVQSKETDLPPRIKRSKKADPSTKPNASSDGHESVAVPKKAVNRGHESRQVSGDVVNSTEGNIARTCQELRELQRRKVASLKARNAISNQIESVIAIELGYSAGLEEAGRKEAWEAARKLIKQIGDGKVDKKNAKAADNVSGIVKSSLMAKDGYEDYLGRVEKQMEKLAKTLPVAKWVEGVRGMGLLSLATIVGECGDLGNYRSPYGLSKRLGMEPIVSRGKTQMPSTWRSGGGLSAEEWTQAGYSPRRRSIMYVIGECLVKQNKGEFRQRYDEAKASAKARHEDWTPGHCHNHAMLLCSKRLIKRLWQAWRGQNGDILPENIEVEKKSLFPAGGEEKVVDSTNRAPTPQKQATVKIAALKKSSLLSRASKERVSKTK